MPRNETFPYVMWEGSLIGPKLFRLVRVSPTLMRYEESSGNDSMGVPKWSSVTENFKEREILEHYILKVLGL